jgi:phosphate ABC transporter phosphate-binding protein
MTIMPKALIVGAGITGLATAIVRTARRTRASLIVLATALVALYVCVLPAAEPSRASSYVPISGAGSTWSGTAIRAWAADVQQFQVTVNYAAVGSTAGRSEFKGGLVDWAASDIPYGVRDGTSTDPPPKRGYAYMPDTAGGLAFVYNLTIGTHRVTSLRLSGAVIAGIFTSKITRWNDRRIAADNPRLKLPATPIVPVVRSDGSGTTAEFTQWMIATQASYWTSYCRAAGRSPCTQTSVYPVRPGTEMIDVPGDSGIAAYVHRRESDGTIGYVGYSYALETGSPVAKVLNAAGYYTLPTAGNVAVALLKARIDMNPRDPRYLTQNLSRVYTDRDPRAYELSFYSYIVLPTTRAYGLTVGKGFTLGAFGQFAVCLGQSQVDALGYSALPVSLVRAAFAQLRKIPGSKVPAITAALLRQCHNPAFSSTGTNALATHDPMPPACDRRGPRQCTTPARRK